MSCIFCRKSKGSWTIQQVNVPQPPPPPNNISPDPIPPPVQIELHADKIPEENHLGHAIVEEAVQETESKQEIKENGLRSEESVSKTGSDEEVIVATGERRPGISPISVNYDENDIEAIPKHPKSQEDEKTIRSAIEANEFLYKIIHGDLMLQVVDAMYNRDIKSKETLIVEGESGNHMYVSAKGKYEVTTKAGYGATFSDARVFGELAILYNDSRKATIRALKAGRVWVLDREIFQKLRLFSNIREQDEILQFLADVPQLQFVGDQIQRVAELLKIEHFLPDEVIVKQGEVGDKFYIIRTGAVKITRNGNVVGKLTKGSYFGERALLSDDTRAATVTAEAPGAECYTLPRQAFLDHVDTTSSFRPLPAEEAPHNSEYDAIELTDWKIHTTLGIGGFGRVELVYHKNNKDMVCALKYLKKADMVEQNQQEHVQNERNLQIICNCQFITRLYRSYTNKRYVYFLLESCMGGDLFTLLQRQPLKRFEEGNARFIAASILEALAYLHERNIAYRDLKPENILIDERGYIKLTDFGFAKKLDHKGRTYTFAGTPEYMAPEILLSKGHNKAVDYWEFGIFIYELLVGRTPFRSNDPSHSVTYNKILAGIESANFPGVVTTKARHLIEKLCQQLPSERLGCGKNGVGDIRANRWFLGFEWETLRAGKMRSPFKPKLKSKLDAKHFEKFAKDTDIPPDDNTQWADF